MKHPLVIITTAGEHIMLNEDNICSIKKANTDGSLVEIAMNNGDVHKTTSIPWHEWDNDRILRKD